MTQKPRINFRLSEQLVELLNKKSEPYGLNPSEYNRYLVMKDLIENGLVIKEMKNELEKLLTKVNGKI